jgi:phosphatidylserine/phosphatidylglycerophosphate/cardiolipin synthase-like enzyme
MMTGVPDRTLPFHAAHAYYKQLLDSGVKVYQYTAGFLHAKTVVVDGQWCIIGTCNFDVRSTILHDEVSCVIYDEGIAADYAAVYEDDLGARPPGQVAQLGLAAVLAAALSRDGRSRAWAGQRGLAWAPAAGRDVA